MLIGVFEADARDCVVMALEDGVVCALAVCLPEQDSFVEAARCQDFAICAELCGEDIRLLLKSIVLDGLSVERSGRKVELRASRLEPTASEQELTLNYTRSIQKNSPIASATSSSNSIAAILACTFT